MSDYTQVNNFGAKDDLPVGAAEKVIYGAEWDEEFDAISTAIATKYDSGDLSDQSTAEAGSSNTVLMTPLRQAQYAAARGVGTLGKFLDNWNITDGVGGFGTTTSYVEFISRSYAAGWNDFELYVPYTRTGTGSILSIQFSPSTSLTYFMAAVDDPNSSGGFSSLVTVGDLTDPEITISTTVASDTIKVRGSFFVGTAGTLTIKMKHTVSGGTASVTIESGLRLLQRGF